MRSVFWLCVTLTVVSCVMSTNLWRELRAERELAVVLRARVTEGTAGDSTVSSATTPVASALNLFPESPTKPGTVTAVRATPASDAAGASRDAAGRQRELWRNPEYRKARLAQIRTSISRNNAGLAEQLGISSAEVERLVDLMAEYDLNVTMSLSLTETNQGDSAASQELARSLQEAARQRDEGIAAVLGHERYLRWQEYQQNAPARNLALSFGNALSQAHQPLAPGQLKFLTEALVVEVQRQRREAMVLVRDTDRQDGAKRAQGEEAVRQREEEANQRLLTTAATILNAQQLEVIAAYIKQQTAISLAMSRARDRAAVQKREETQ